MDREYLLLKMGEYEDYLRMEEKSENTISKYVRDIQAFFFYAGAGTVEKEMILSWKEKLIRNYAPSSVNSMLAAVNGFFDWLGYLQYKVKPLRIQREIFCRPERELTKVEYGRLVEAAKKRKNDRLSFLIQTICATGIRVSELRFITVESVQAGRAAVDCKGKSRIVFLSRELCKSLNCYCRNHRIKKGPIFCTSKGKPLDRSNIWRDMKSLCMDANVDRSKVFPHNLRHLFARTYYAVEKDLSRLADLLGHSNISTTRIYTMESGNEHIRQLERMGLVFR